MQPFLGSVRGLNQLLNKANGRPVKSKTRFHGNGEVFLDLTFHMCALVAELLR